MSEAPASVTITSSGPLERGVFLPPQVETIPEGVDAVDWAAGCVAHNYHQPVPRYLEQHHVIPRAWQAAWTPDAASPTIWHRETVALCRTGHGNVHYWIERIMRLVAQHGYPDAVAAALLDQENVGRQEHVIARRAIEEWQAAGGSLSLLTDQHLWGGMYGQGE